MPTQLQYGAGSLRSASASSSPGYCFVLTSATLYDPLRSTQTPVSGTGGLTVAVKPNLQILLWE